MNSSGKQIVREVLAEMVEGAPPPPSFEGLSDTRRVEEPDRPRRSALVAALAGLMLAIVAVGSVIVITRSTGTQDWQGANATDVSIFMIPTWIPVDLELYSAEVWSGGDISGGNVTYQTYLPPGISTYVEGDRVVNITVTDYVAVADAAGLDLDTSLDSGTIFADLRKQWEIIYPDSQLSFDLITIRDRPAMVTERVTTVGGVTDQAIGVVVIEGDGHMSNVATHQLTRDAAIAIAESLEPVTSGVFDAYATTAPSTTRP